MRSHPAHAEIKHRDCTLIFASNRFVEASRAGEATRPRIKKTLIRRDFSNKTRFPVE
jgi:hypothetical protein